MQGWKNSPGEIPLEKLRGTVDVAKVWLVFMGRSIGASGETWAGGATPTRISKSRGYQTSPHVAYAAPFGPLWWLASALAALSTSATSGLATGLLEGPALAILEVATTYRFTLCLREALVFAGGDACSKGLVVTVIST